MKKKMRQFPSSLNNLNKVNTSFNKRNIFIPKNYKNFKKKKEIINMIVIY